MTQAAGPVSALGWGLAAGNSLRSWGKGPVRTAVFQTWFFPPGWIPGMLLRSPAAFPCSPVTPQPGSSVPSTRRSPWQSVVLRLCRGNPAAEFPSA